MDKININNLRQLHKNELDKCADIAANAFLDDPSSVFLFKGKLSYQALFDFYLILYNTVFNKMNFLSCNENFDGFIITSSVKNSIVTLNDYIKNGGSKIIFKYGLGIVKRSLEFENNNVKTRKTIVDNNCWYIMQFCVSPRKQGNGAGSKIIKPLLNWFDLNKINCYLETFKNINISMYKHYGFELKYSGLNPKQYALLRNYNA